MILVCAATRTEAAACARGLRSAERERFEVLITGVGPARAGRTLRARLRASPPVLVVSSGFAGALGPELPPLAWVTATALHRLAGGVAVPVSLPPGLLRSVEGAHPCAVLTVEALIAPGELALAGPAAVDMESAALAEAAAERGVPFAVLRLVTDGPDRPLAPAARRLTNALAAPVSRGLALGPGVALAAARTPLLTAAFLRDTGRWRAALAEGWREAARSGVRCTAVR